MPVRLAPALGDLPPTGSPDSGPGDGIIEARTQPLHLKPVDPSASDSASNWETLNEDLGHLTGVITDLERRVATLEYEVQQLRPEETIDADDVVD
jgi:hypothetical protein